MYDMNTSFFDFTTRKKQMADEYKKEMAPLREALKAEVAKKELTFYRGLSLRQFAGFWEIASGGRPWICPLEQLQYQYDLDSPAGFYKFYRSLPGSHILDLDYAVISFYPECADHEAPIEEKPWALFMLSHGWPVMTAEYVRRLQQGGVHFHLQHPKDVLKDFNKEVGYRKRSLRREEKINNKEAQ